MIVLIDLKKNEVFSPDFDNGEPSDEYWLSFCELFMNLDSGWLAVIYNMLAVTFVEHTARRSENWTKNMGAEVKWVREGEIVGIRLYDFLTVEDFATANREGVALNNQTATGAHMIIDASEVTGITPQLAKLRGAIKNVDKDRTGYFVLIVGENPLFRFIGSVMMQLFGGKHGFYITSTYEKALTAINSKFPLSDSADLTLISQDDDVS